MGDRVVFLTVQRPGVNVSGCNSFCFPFTYSAPDPFSPFSTSKDDCMKWLVRVKNWHLDTDAAIVDTDGNPWSLSTQDLTPNAGNAQRENQIRTFPKNPTFNNADVTNANLSFVVQQLIYRNSGLLYPAWLAQAVVGPDENKGQLQISSDPSAFGPGPSSITGSIDGNDLLIYYLPQSPIGTVPMSFTFTTLVLTPVEYWPYAARDGSPIYNTTTGAQLQDPRS